MRSSLNASLLVNLPNPFFFSPCPSIDTFSFLFFSFSPCIIDFIPRDLNGLDFYVFLSSNLRIRNFFEKRIPKRYSLSILTYIRTARETVLPAACRFLHNDRASIHNRSSEIARIAFVLLSTLFK